MKGFLPRERIGLIILGCIVAACFCIEPIAKTAGCSRTQETSDNIGSSDDSVSEKDSSVTEESEWIRRVDRSVAHRSSDSTRDLRKGKSKSSKKKKPKSKKAERQTAPSSRRSLRDEKIDI